MNIIKYQTPKIVAHAAIFEFGVFIKSTYLAVLETGRSHISNLKK